MSFLGGKRTTLGPRGTRISSGARVMGYVADDHAFTRGPGAIASVDGATNARRRARVQALSLSAKRDAELARMTQPNARAVVGKVGGKRVLMPGQQATRAMRPGEIVPVKYPGQVGYQKPTRFGGGTAKRIGVGGSVAGARASAAISPVLTYGGVGVGQPGTTVIAPQPAAGNVSPYGGSVDPGAGDPSGGGAITGGGGGGGGGATDSGGGGSAYDPGSDAYDDDIPDGTVDDGGGDSGGSASIATTSPSAPIPSTVTPSIASVPKWAWWAAAVAGAWWLLRK